MLRSISWFLVFILFTGDIFSLAPKSTAEDLAGVLSESSPILLGEEEEDKENIIPISSEKSSPGYSLNGEVELGSGILDAIRERIRSGKQVIFLLELKKAYPDGVETLFFSDDLKKAKLITRSPQGNTQQYNFESILSRGKVYLLTLPVSDREAMFEESITRGDSWSINLFKDITLNEKLDVSLIDSEYRESKRKSKEFEKISSGIYKNKDTQLYDVMFGIVFGLSLLIVLLAQGMTEWMVIAQIINQSGFVKISAIIQGAAVVLFIGWGIRHFRTKTKYKVRMFSMVTTGFLWFVAIIAIGLSMVLINYQFLETVSRSVKWLMIGDGIAIGAGTILMIILAGAMALYKKEKAEALKVRVSHMTAFLFICLFLVLAFLLGFMQIGGILANYHQVVYISMIVSALKLGLMFVEAIAFVFIPMIILIFRVKKLGRVEYGRYDEVDDYSKKSMLRDLAFYYLIALMILAIIYVLEGVMQSGATRYISFIMAGYHGVAFLLMLGVMGYIWGKKENLLSTWIKSSHSEQRKTRILDYFVEVTKWCLLVVLLILALITSCLGDVLMRVYDYYNVVIHIVTQFAPPLLIALALIFVPLLQMIERKKYDIRTAGYSHVSNDQFWMLNNQRADQQNRVPLWNKKVFSLYQIDYQSSRTDDFRRLDQHVTVKGQAATVLEANRFMYQAIYKHRHYKRVRQLFFIFLAITIFTLLTAAGQIGSNLTVTSNYQILLFNIWNAPLEQTWLPIAMLGVLLLVSIILLMFSFVVFIYYRFDKDVKTTIEVLDEQKIMRKAEKGNRTQDVAAETGDVARETSERPNRRPKRRFRREKEFEDSTNYMFRPFINQSHEMVVGQGSELTLEESVQEFLGDDIGQRVPQEVWEHAKKLKLRKGKVEEMREEDGQIRSARHTEKIIFISPSLLRGQGDVERKHVMVVQLIVLNELFQAEQEQKQKQNIRTKINRESLEYLSQMKACSILAQAHGIDCDEVLSEFAEEQMRIHGCRKLYKSKTEGEAETEEYLQAHKEYWSLLISLSRKVDIQKDLVDIDGQVQASHTDDLVALLRVQNVLKSAA